MRMHNLRTISEESLQKLIVTHANLDNFQRRTLERVIGILANSEMYSLDPLVVAQLTEIVELANHNYDGVLE